MLSDEAPSLSEPQKYVTVKKVKKIYGLIIYVMFIVILALVVNNLIIYNWYNDTNKQFRDAFLRIKAMSEEKGNLECLNEDLSSDYVVLKKEFSNIINQNEEISKELEELRIRNRELEEINAELSQDNIELQNTLKKAASVGIKPQNYTSFNDLSPSKKVERGDYVGKFHGTAYTPCKDECGNNNGITNSGKPIIPGVSVAVDKKYWPLGTIFYIKGLGYAVAMDTGSAIKGKYRFDFAVFDRNFAKKLGTDYWDVYLIKLGTGKVEDVKI
ncbi:MAG: hypothetical protein GX660_20475 [Clostridiaceae bacterium]|nr:hypothetical protein [Clostridiaceae bacterium]